MTALRGNIPNLVSADVIEHTAAISPILEFTDSTQESIMAEMSRNIVFAPVFVENVPVLRHGHLALG